MHLYTIGYSGVKLPDFQQFAEDQNLVIVDTRFKPRSRVPQWNKGPLTRTLGDRYAHIEAFGNLNYKGGPIAIQDLPAGIIQVERLLKRCDGIILMCVCADLATCHRRVVSEALEQHFGVQAVHLSAKDLSGGKPPAPPVDWSQMLLL